MREHVLTGRSFSSLAELDGAFAAWLRIRRWQTHRTHGEVLAVRAARDREALLSRPGTDYLVADRRTCAGSARTAWSRSRPAATQHPSRA